MESFKCQHVKEGRAVFWRGYCERCHDVIFKPPVERLEFPLSDEEYESLLLLQGGKCALCGKIPSEQRRLDTDHDHQTGRVRGLLCNTCNWQLIGRIEGQRIPLSRIAKYLDPERVGSFNPYLETVE